MGFVLDRVASDVKHYGPFVCSVCQNLASLDVVVTTCNHPFCLPCLQVWMQKRIAEDLNCRCPACREDLEAPEQEPGKTFMIENRPIRAQSLETAQPLAYSVLKNVQVKCSSGVTTVDSEECYWIGDYGELQKHQVEHKLKSVRSPSMSNTGNATANKDIRVDTSGGRPPSMGPTSQPNGMHAPIPNPSPYMGDESQSRAGVTTRGEATAAHHARTLPQHSQEPGQVNLPDLKRAMDRCDKLKKQANAKFNRGDVEGARLLYSEGLALISNFPIEEDDVRIMTASLFSNRAVTFFRERILPPSIDDCDRSLELDKTSEKTYIRKWRALSALGDIEAATQCLKDGIESVPSSQKLAEELRKSQAPSATPTPSKTNQEFMDASYSIASMSQFDAVSRGGDYLESSVDQPSAEMLDRAERLKKQANAKFNKGDIEAARVLYTDALGCIPKKTNYSPDVKALLAMLYSNRAVTFFRDKMYRESLGDCEKAIELDPEAEKSYIRKSRALAGLELHEEAHRCLEQATKKLTHSKKLVEELEKAAAEKEAQEDAHEKNDVRKDFDGLTSADSGEFNNSVGSFNFYITPDAEKGASRSSGIASDAYAEELDLADKLKRNANAKFNRGDIAGARLLYTEALACLPNDRDNDEVRACLASLYANRAVTFFREKEFGPSTWDCDKAIELDPKNEKSYIRKARALISLQRFDEAIASLETGQKEAPGSSRLADEIFKATEQKASEEAKTPDVTPGDSKMSISDQNAQDFQVSSHFNYDPSQPAGGAFFISPSIERPTLDSVAEGRSQEFDLPSGGNEDLERAEKLKKQANAKLNKGDVAGARILYGEGLACLPASGPDSPEGRELAASLYANRAVTFFREKKFAATVADCDKSLELDAKHEKSYIRKWRALMALGNFEDAYKCLDDAVRELPNSDRLNEELANAAEQKELLATVNQLIEEGDYQEARETLKPLVKTSDNVSLWLAAARADACLGLTESALERVNKVLLFNPQHVEGLQVRGYAMFLSGEMEHGIGILKEALEADIEHSNKKASDLVGDCQRTFSAFGKGQARVKRGRYKEAVDLFSAALEDYGNLPNESPLFGLLLTERAEASLLSHQYEEALDDCIDAIKLKNDNMTAWTVKVEVYFALGRLQEARDELSEVRKSWGAGNDTIEDAYKKTDFELRLKRADEDLHRIVASVESGVPPEIREGEPLHMTRDDKRGSTPKPPSHPTQRSPRIPLKPPQKPVGKESSERRSRRRNSSDKKLTRQNSKSGRKSRGMKAAHAIQT
jgi:tetratricopeptide (TPR) repeat protein